jgi:hypothetical protein
MIKNPAKPIKKLHSILNFNGEFQSTNLAIYSDDGEVMLVLKIV